MGAVSMAVGASAPCADALTVAPTLSGAMTLSHFAASRSTTTLAVVSLAPTWTLTVKDSSGSNPGYLKECTLSGGGLIGTPAPSAQPLSRPLKLSADPAAQTDPSLYQPLGSGTQTVATGALSQTKTIYWYEPPLAISDSVAGGRSYCTQITYTVTETS